MSTLTKEVQDLRDDIAKFKGAPDNCTTHHYSCDCINQKIVSLIDRLSARCEELSRQRDEQYQSFLLQRGVEIPCKRCSGLGVAVYGDSSTWRRGGCAGQVITSDICDLCWGTGDANRKGADLKAINGKINSLLKAVEPILLAPKYSAKDEQYYINIKAEEEDFNTLASVVQKIKGEKG